MNCLFCKKPLIYSPLEGNSCSRSPTHGSIYDKITDTYAIAIATNTIFIRNFQSQIKTLEVWSNNNDYLEIVLHLNIEMIPDDFIDYVHNLLILK